jgi:urease subunit gamma/beta
VHLTPREQERILLSSAADLARRRLARGARLGAPDATALVCDEVCELAWDGIPLTEVIERARSLVPGSALVDGVAEAVPVIEVEALFPHGSTLVHIDRPFGSGDGTGPGAVRVAAADRELAAGRPRTPVTLHNTGHRPIWVSSHVPLDQLNHALEVDLADAGRYRLDLPAGAAVEVGPQETRTVHAVEIGGGRR